MERSKSDYAQDILDAIDYIEEDTAGHTFGSFSSSRQTQQLVERNLEIVSEAARRLPEEETAQEPQIPWHDVRGIGNLLRHEYRKVSSKELWDTVGQDIEPLKESVQRIRSRLLAQEGNG